MQKKYIINLSKSERQCCEEVVKRLKGSSQKVRRAQILLQADSNGPNWPDAQIAAAYRCRTKTVENIRQRFVERGFEESLNRKKRDKPPTPKLLDGKQEAKILAMRLGQAPEGYANWTLRLLARKVVELEVADTISHETVRQTIKKTA
jgi:transposase